MPSWGFDNDSLNASLDADDETTPTVPEEDRSIEETISSLLDILDESMSAEEKQQTLTRLVQKIFRMQVSCAVDFYFDN